MVDDPVLGSVGRLGEGAVAQSVDARYRLLRVVAAPEGVVARLLPVVRIHRIAFVHVQHQPGQPVVFGPRGVAGVDDEELALLLVNEYGGTLVDLASVHRLPRLRGGREDDHRRVDRAGVRHLGDADLLYGVGSVARPDGVALSLELEGRQVDGVFRVRRGGLDARLVVIAREEHAHVLPLAQRVVGLRAEHAAALGAVTGDSVLSAASGGIVDVPAVADVEELGSPKVGDVPGFRGAFVGEAPFLGGGVDHREPRGARNGDAVAARLAGVVIVAVLDDVGVGHRGDVASDGDGVGEGQRRLRDDDFDRIDAVGREAYDARALLRAVLLEGDAHCEVAFAAAAVHAEPFAPRFGGPFGVRRHEHFERSGGVGNHLFAEIEPDVRLSGIAAA